MEGGGGRPSLPMPLPAINPTRSPKRQEARERSNSDTNAADCSVVIAAPNSPGLYVQLNASTSPKGRYHRTTLRGAASPSPEWPTENRSRGHSSSDLEYGSMTPLTPRRKRVIELKGSLANSVLVQLRTAWPGAWFALQLDSMQWDAKDFARYLTDRRRRGRQEDGRTRLLVPPPRMRANTEASPLSKARQAGGAGGAAAGAGAGAAGRAAAVEQSDRPVTADRTTMGSVGFIFVLVTNCYSGGSLVVPWVFIESGVLGGLALER